MKKLLSIGCIIATVLMAGYGFAQTSDSTKDNGQGKIAVMGGTQGIVDRSAGEKIFNDNCAKCHPDGGNVVVPDLPLRGSRVLSNFRTFAAFVRNPKMPDGSQGSMPSFGKSKLTNTQARDLYHFIKTSTGYGLRGGYGMGGYGMGPGMMCGGYGMGPGMMGGGYGMRGYGMGPGMMGYYAHSPECQKFFDDTAKQRKELHDKRFEYFETLRNPKSTGEMASRLENEIRELQEKIFSEAPLGCGW